MSWKTCKHEFTFDGSWRDIYVLETSSSDWNKFLSSLSSWTYSTRCWIDGIEANPPHTIEDALALRREANLFLHIEVTGVTLACHFFTADEIEFDLDPREVNGERELQGITQFMRRLGILLEKRVILTPENFQTRPIISYDPSKDELRYLPAEAT